MPRLLFALLGAALAIAIPIPGAAASPALLTGTTLDIVGPSRSLLGFTVSSAGDLNGDRLDDLALTAPNLSPRGRKRAGAVYVVFGRRRPATLRLHRRGRWGFRVDGPRANPSGGVEVSAAGGGDFNGDGRDDLVVGFSGATCCERLTAGSAYVLLGSRSRRGVDLARPLGSRGLRIKDRFRAHGAGSAVSLGDVNGDGLVDVVVGRSLVKSGRPAAHVVFGTRHPGRRVSLAHLGRRGFALLASRADALASAADRTALATGDINGDRRKDVVIGLNGAVLAGREDAGSAAVVFGTSKRADAHLEALGRRGFRITSPPAAARFASAAASGADVNGDGLDDVVLGAESGAGQRSPVYVFFGKRSSADVNGGPLPGGGFRILGGRNFYPAPRPFSLVGDLDGDRRSELLIGTPGSVAFTPQQPGEAWLVRGQETVSDIDLRSAGDLAQNVIGPVPKDRFGFATAAAGDVNGDGSQDIVIGAFHRSFARVLFGARFP
jgi:hypothetical protein